MSLRQPPRGHSLKPKQLKWEVHIEQDGFSSYNLLNVNKDWNDVSEETVIPLPRSGHRMVSDDTYLYSLGGLVHSDQVGTSHPNFRCMEVRAELFRFHILTQRWQTITLRPPLKNLTASHAMCKLGRHLMVHGGTGIPFGRVIDKDVHLIDIESGETYRIPCALKDDNEEHLPIPAYGQSLTVVPENMPGHYKIYRIFGTIGTEYLTEVYCLHWPEAVWELVWSYPGYELLSSTTTTVHSRYRHSTFLIDDEIWIFGGAPLIDGEPGFKTIDIFVLKTHSWRYVTCDVSHLKPSLVEDGMPVFNSVEKLGENIYLFGGSGPLPLITGPFNVVHRLCLRTLTWYPLSLKWKIPAYFSASCPGPCGDEVYIFGGVTQPSAEYQRSNTMWRMQLPFHSVPPLIELAWRAFSRRLQQYHVPEENQSQVLELQLRRLCDHVWCVNREKCFKRWIANCLTPEDLVLLKQVPSLYRKRFGWPVIHSLRSMEETRGQEASSTTDLDAG